MLLTALLSISLVMLSTFVHYEFLRLCNDLLPHARFIARRAKVLAAVAVAMCSHAAQIALFALAYYMLQDAAGLGTIAGHFQNAFSSFMYFSTETYTSLGFGDMYPLGQIRMLAGIEALTGLLMISWTASFTYLEMSRFWENA